MSKTTHSLNSLPELTPTELKKQQQGWLAILFFLFFFPIMFFLCVYFPIWVGWIPRFP
ncbi:MAG: hypothetical protein OXC40_03355 [Proteobacteria bacterium]|nr:hypothetical protein [Pseudomonadota bacterium]